ncbi:MAG TPA: hypothetical protein VFE77_15045 [Rhodanobacter sp.]|nr:hypothetical protein [Rhodanobacter sp.]
MGRPRVDAAVAGIFPALERRYGWKVFPVMPPIVMTYLLVTALVATGLWQINKPIRATQSTLGTGFGLIVAPIMSPLAV